jgi:hypothetical protein
MTELPRGADVPGPAPETVLSSLVDDRYVWFYDEDAFEQVSPGMRRRVVAGEHLSVWFWRIDESVGPTAYHVHRQYEQLGFVAAGELEFRIGGGGRQRLGPGSFYLAPPGVAHGESTFRGDPAKGGEVWLVDVFSPPRVEYADDRSDGHEGEHDAPAGAADGGSGE